MEQSTSLSSSSLLASATADEIIVSQILLDLKSLVSLSESLSNFNWGRKRRRSCLEVPPPLPRASSLLLPSAENRIEVKKLTALKDVDGDGDGGGGRTTVSPDTPLSFSPSEIGKKPKHSVKKSSNKRSRQRVEFLDMVETLTRRKELLTGEIENAKKYYEKLKAYNSQLKAKMQEVLNSGVVKAQECQNCIPGDDGRGWVNQGAPRGFDLNIPAEEAFNADLDAVADRRSRFAEARRKRIEIMKNRLLGLRFRDY